MNATRLTRCRGSTLIEILITIVILMVGLLGLAKLQGVATAAQTEAYQRSQAVVLLKDMADRINANRANALDYVTASPLGTGNGVQDCSALTGQALDSCEWNNALLGTTEISGGTEVGAMIGARGCIYNTDASEPREFMIAVAWQGLYPTSTPTSVACGLNSYGGQALRRVVTMTITIAKLN